MIRRLLILALAAALLGALTVPFAGAEGPSAVVAKKSKCKKKGKKSAAAAKKKCKRTAATTPPGLPGSALSPDSPTVPTVSSVTVSSNPVLGGTNVSGEVTIGEPAPTGGREVTLESDDPGTASVPASVQVAAGETTAGFTVETTEDQTASVAITASIGASSRQVVLNVVADPSVESVALDYDCFPELQTGFGVNQVTTDVPVPADTPVSLASDSLSLLTPLSVTVPEDANSATFGVNTLMADPDVTVTATLGTSSAFDTASVRSASTPSALVDLTLDPTSVQPPGSSTGTVTLDCEALASTPAITLASGNPNVTVPASVTVPEGETTASFQITTLPAATGEAVITANDGQPDEQQATLLLDQLGT